MAEFPETRLSLIAEVKDPENQVAWEQFVAVYRPVIVRTALARGLQESDAQDLAQQVLMAVSSAIGQWEPQDQSSRFRHWLKKVTRNAILNALSRGPKVKAMGGSTIQELLVQHPKPDQETESLIDWEYRRQVFRRAAAIVRNDVTDDTWRAFELTVIDKLGNQEAAEQLGKSLGTIYTARCRVMQRLRIEVAQLEKEEA